MIVRPRQLTAERLRDAVRTAIAARPAAVAAGEALVAGGGPQRFADAAQELAASRPRSLSPSARPAGRR